MTYKVDISGIRIIDVEDGDCILESALSQGIDYPHGCRSGNCGACKSKLISGEVDMMPYSEFALEDSEKENMLILACRSIPKTDCNIKIINNIEQKSIEHDTKELSYEVSKISKVTKDIITIKLSNISNDKFDFFAGQYAELKFNNLDSRQFSMANCPSEKQLEFHVKTLDEGLISKYISEKLSVGEKVKITGPYGNSYLRENHKGPILGIAGGTGLAPILSIALASQEKKMKQPVSIYIGARTENDFYYLEQFKKLSNNNPNFNFFPIISDQTKVNNIRTGLVTDAVMEDIEDFDGFKVYLAGPPPMVEAAEKLFPNLGLRKNDIHADAFYNKYEEFQNNE